MQKSTKCVLAALLMFCFIRNVNATECSYEKQVELNNQASTVKATYEEVEIDTGQTYSYVDENDIIHEDKQIPLKAKGFNVKILNITNDISVNVTSDDNKINKNYFYSDSNNGVIDLTTTLSDKVIAYTIKIYSNVEGCNLELRTITLITPMYNTYSELGFCAQYPDFEYCQEYTTDSNFNLNDFKEKSEVYKKTVKSVENDKKTKKNENKLKEFLKDNRTLLIIIGSIILIVGGSTTVIIVIRKRSRLI